jgi:TolA-binding protein
LIKFQLLILAIFLVTSTGLFAATEAYDKGFADGKAFGQRTGKTKGEKTGIAKGMAEGHKKGMADAESGTVLPAPSSSSGGNDEAEQENDLPPVDAETVAEPATIDTEEAPVTDQPEGEIDSNDSELPTADSDDNDSGETLTEKALRQYPDLLPQAPSLDGVSDTVVSEPTTGLASMATNAAAGKGLIGDAELEYSTEYSKGFALGYLAGYKETYSAAEDAGYEKGWAEGYQKGQEEYKQLHFNSNGEVLTAEQQYKMGRALLMNEKYEDSIVRFDLVADGGFDNEFMDDALYWKAWACYNTGQFQRAIKTVSQMLEILSDSSLADDALYCKGMCYEYLETGGFLGMGQKKHYIEAAECFYTLIASYPDSPIVAPAYFRLGFNYERLKDKKAAIKAYKIIVDNYPNSNVAFKAQRRLQDLQ